MKKFFQYFILIIIIGGLISYFIQNKSALEPLQKIDNSDVLIILVFIFIGNHIRSAQLQYFTDALGNKITYLNAFSITVGGTLINYLPFNAGIFFKASALKKMKIKYAHFISISIVEILVTLIASSLIGVATLITSSLDFNFNHIYLFPFFFIVLLLSIVMLLIPSSWFVKQKNKLLIIIGDYLHGVEQIIKKPKIFILISIFVTTRLFLISLIIFNCFSGLGTEISLLGAIFVSTTTSLLMIVNITPGGLGIRELIIGAISLSTGGTFEVGVLASAIMRGCSLVIHVFFGIPSLIYLKTIKII